MANPSSIRLLVVPLARTSGDEQWLLGLKTGFVTTKASSVAAATGQAASGNADVVLVTVGALDPQVWEKVASLREAAPKVPVVVLADTAESVDARHSLRAGVQDILVRGRTDAAELARSLAFAVERERVNQERLASLDRLRELEAFKTQFINTAAHELNAPLTPIKLQLHMMRDRLPADDLRSARSMDIIDRNVDRLIALVRDVLEAARLQAHRLKIRVERINLARTLEEGIETMRGQAAHAGVQLDLAVPAELYVDADPERMTQVLHNLLSNAIKFTPSGGHIEVEASTPGNQVVVTVRDTGIGLRPGDFEKLFQPFSQTHEWTGRRPPGSGLGLFITQGILEQHGGRIWCDSPGPDQGATFSFALERAEGPLKDPSLAARPSVRPERRRGFWPILYFKCPTCGSRDLNMRILRNRYECRACTFHWK